MNLIYPFPTSIIVDHDDLAPEGIVEIYHKQTTTKFFYNQKGKEEIKVVLVEFGREILSHGVNRTFKAHGLRHMRVTELQALGSYNEITKYPLIVALGSITVGPTGRCLCTALDKKSNSQFHTIQTKHFLNIWPVNCYFAAVSKQA